VRRTKTKIPYRIKRQIGPIALRKTPTTSQRKENEGKRIKEKTSIRKREKGVFQKSKREASCL